MSSKLQVSAVSLINEDSRRSCAVGLCLNVHTMKHYNIISNSDSYII